MPSHAILLLILQGDMSRIVRMILCKRFNWGQIIVIWDNPSIILTGVINDWKKCNKKLYVKWYEPLMLRGIECDLTIIVSDNGLAY